MVSIIVPIYKVEKYIVQCIKSVLDQTYPDIEIILVDDGSPDNCGKICDEYAKIDARIKVIHKENQGLGMARNTGLEHATGDFICFLDSDDWLDSNAIETWVKYQEKYDADLVMCHYEKRDDSNNVLYRYKIVENAQYYASNEEVQKNIFWPMIGQKSTAANDFTINMCVWTNLYRHSIIKNNNIRFLSEREYLSEDICFNLQFLLKTQDAVMIPESLYYYPTSLTNCYKGDEFGKAKKLYFQVCKWADLASNQFEREYRLHRFFITKVRELMFRLCGSSICFTEKCSICKDIESDNLLTDILIQYPICKYKIKYFVPALFMKLRLVSLTVMLFGFLRKR